MPEELNGTEFDKGSVRVVGAGEQEERGDTGAH